MAITLIFIFMWVIILYPAKIVFSKFMTFLYASLLLLLIHAEFIKFTFFSQAKVLIDVNPDLFYWFTVGHVHAIRLLVAYPSYILSNFLNIDLDLAFSYYCVFMFSFLYLIITNTTIKITNIKQKINIQLSLFITLIPFLILPFIMNGRLIAAYLGFVIMINLFIRLFNREAISILKIALTLLLAITLTSVSSGIIMISVSYTFLLLYIYIFKFRDKRIGGKKLFFLLVVSLPVIIQLVEYIFIMIMRNITYFGGGFGGFINMFNHGIGRYLTLTIFQTIVTIFFLIIILFINIWIVRKLFYKNNRILPILLAVNLSLYGFLFGYSTGLLVVPALIILIMFYCQNGIMLSSRRLNNRGIM